MTDYFALFDEPRRPWLEPDALKQKFVARSGAVHPDKIHSASEAEKAAAARAFAELNAAHQCLAEPKSRLLHLLELELGAKPADIQAIPAGLADLFTEVATCCRSTDGLLAEKARTTSPLLQLALFERAQEWLEKIEGLAQKLDEFNRRLTGELQALDARWLAADAAGRRTFCPGWKKIYRLAGYFNRWNRQLAERKMQLLT